VHEAAVEEMVRCRIGVRLVEAPARLAFGVWAHDGDREERGEMFDVADEVCAVGEWAE
jgi:TolB-like protein